MKGSFDSRPRVCFEVEKVIGISSDGSYQVQWAPAWVSRFHLVGCEHLIDEFLQEQGQKEEQVRMPHPLNQSSENYSEESEMLHFQRDNYTTLPPEYTEEDAENDNKPGGGVPSTLDKGGTDKDSRLDEDIVTRENFPDESSWVLMNGKVDNAIQSVEPVSNNDLLPDAFNIISVKIEEEATEHTDGPSLSSAIPIFKEYFVPIDVDQGGEDPIEGTTSAEIHMEANTNSAGSVNDDFLVQPDISSTVCSICQKDCIDQTQLMIHLTTHTESKSHICKYCLKVFTRQGNLMQHMRTHTGEKPYACYQCNKSFSRKADLDRHSLIHQRIQSGSKKYCCKNCGKNFTQACHLYRHGLRCSSTKYGANS